MEKERREEMSNKMIVNKGNSLLRCYIAVISLSSLIGIMVNLSEILTKSYISISYSKSLSLIGFFIFIFSIYCFFQFKKQKLPRITMILPLYKIILFPALLLSGFSFGLFSLIYNVDYQSYFFTYYPLLALFSLIINLLELGFAIYLYRCFYNEKRKSNI